MVLCRLMLVEAENGLFLVVFLSGLIAFLGSFLFFLSFLFRPKGDCPWRADAAA